MVPRLCRFAVLVLLLVAAGDSHHTPNHTTRHGGRVRPAHRTSKAAHVARKAKRQSASDGPQLETLKAINVVRFDFGDDGTLEKEMIASGRYDPKMVLVYDITMDDYKRDRIFLTTPLTRRGIPVTLSTIPFDGVIDPLPKPYPNLEIHHTTEDNITDCNSQLVDVVRTAKTWADDDTLYALDGGNLDLLTSPKNVCPPKIVVFDLLTDEVKSTTIIENAACNSFYNYFWVDACTAGTLTAYSSDSRGNVLSVTDLTTGASKHLRSQYFHPTPGFFFVEAGGPAYYLPDGLNGVTAEQGCDGKIYFQALASNIQGVVDKQVIHDAKDGDVLDVITQVDLPGKLSGPTGSMVVDPTGQLLFFPLQNELAMYCWNTNKPHDPKNFHMIAQDNERLQFISSIYIDTKTQRLYINSDRLTSYVSNTTNYSEDNYRIMYINLKDVEC